MNVAYIGAVLIIVGFSWLLVRLGLVERAKDIAGISRKAMATLSDPKLDDDAKEKALRQHSIALFSRFFTLTFGLCAALGLPILVIWLLSLAHIWSFEDVMLASVSWPILLGGLLLFVAVLMVPRRDVQK